MRETTSYLVFIVIFIVLSAIQYGYHISELNTPKEIMSCQSEPSVGTPVFAHIAAVRAKWNNVACIPMDDSDFSLVTSIFMLGGLGGSLAASKLADRYGRRGATLLSTILLFIGPLVMFFASTRNALVIGRTIVGLGSGIVTVVVPMYLSEVAPVNLRGIIGVLNQMGIVSGILFAQIQGLYLSTLDRWRWILLTGSVIAAVQLVLFPLAIESPKYLASREAGHSKARKALMRLRGRTDVELEIKTWQQEDHDESRGRLMTGDDELDIETTSPSPTIQQKKKSTSGISILKFIVSPAYRNPLYVVLIVQMAQQLTGINATMSYSVSILSEVLPSSAKYIGVLISIFNMLSTFIPIYLIEKAGRRSLLLTSVSCIGVSSFLLAIGIALRIGVLSSIAILAVVVSFGIGLGPIPFLIIPEVVDFRGVGAATSLGLAVNWAGNFLVVYFFLQIREVIGGKVFLIFTALALLMVVLIRRFVPETKGKTVEQVWEDSMVREVND